MPGIGCLQPAVTATAAVNQNSVLAMEKIHFPYLVLHSPWKPKILLTQTIFSKIFTFEIRIF